MHKYELSLSTQGKWRDRCFKGVFLWTQSCTHRQTHTNKSFPKDCLCSNLLSSVLFFCSTMRKKALLELHQSLLHGESVLETFAYKWTKASTHTFGPTVLEEGKKAFYRDNERNHSYENSVFPEKKKETENRFILILSCLRMLESFHTFSGFLEAEGCWGNSFGVCVCS